MTDNPEKISLYPNGEIRIPSADEFCPYADLLREGGIINEDFSHRVIRLEDTDEMLYVDNKSLNGCKSYIYRISLCSIGSSGDYYIEWSLPVTRYDLASGHTPVACLNAEFTPQPAPAFAPQ